MSFNLLKSGCEQLDLLLTEQQYINLDKYIKMLSKWNKVYNLTAITEQNSIITKHILDSLSIIKYIDTSDVVGNEFEVIDIGTGAGLPGIIIAIVKPNFKVKLLDSNSKKTTFLQQVKIQLGLNNITVINKRSKEYTPVDKNDVVIARAFSSLTNYIKNTKHLVKQQGTIWAMKGKTQKQEIVEFESKYPDFTIRNIYSLQVPFLEEERCLIEIKKLI